MDTGDIRGAVTEAIRYWEPRRIAYNAVLAAIALAYFWHGYPGSRQVVSADGILALFLLVVLANAAYCAAYIVDLFVQMSGFRERWRSYRRVLFGIGLLFAGILVRFWSMNIFLSPSR
jgi:hypothetical protein